MTRPLHVGITGGIGSGKSLVSKIFGSLGVPLYDADSRARTLMTSDAILMDEIRKTFGDQSYVDNGKLNRDYLSNVVFNDAAKLAVLNGLVHPAVARDYLRWSEENKSHPYVLKEAALLFEAGSYKTLDKIIVVQAPEDLRIARVQKRDPHRNIQKIKDIIRSQMAEEEKLRRADFIVRNDESELVIPQVLALHEKFLKGI